MRFGQHTLKHAGRQSTERARGTKPRAVQLQATHPKLWAMCDPDQAKKTRTVAIFSTGDPVSDDAGAASVTFRIQDRSLAFHVFGLHTALDRAGRHV